MPAYHFAAMHFSNIQSRVVAEKLLTCQLQNFSSPQVRQHVGYIPFEGLLHPWNTEETRIQRQVNKQ